MNPLDLANPNPVSTSAAFDKAINEGATVEQALQAEAESVFGVGFKRDRHGRPIEQGIGSPGHETENHYMALRKSEGVESERAARAAAEKRKGG